MSDHDDQPHVPSEQAPGRRCGRCGAINARSDAVVCSTCGALLAAYDAPAGSSAAPDAVTPVAPAPPVDTTAAPVSAQRSATSVPRQTTSPPPIPTVPLTPATRPTTTPRPPATDVLDTKQEPARSNARGKHPTENAPFVAQSHVPATTAPLREPAQQSPRPPLQSPGSAIPTHDDGPEEDRPDDIPPPMPRSTAPPAPRPAAPAQPVRPSSVYPARSRLARQTPQTILLVGIGLVLLICVLSVILTSTGANTAAGFFIICGGPFALFVLGLGIVLLVTRARTDQIPK